ncbi:matrix metalloproteinase-14-like [Pectinophora gossypiella]|uniref:matrix metalloproteinase-14-like n=1 Tax=Pectinophora gossypiella TaxID=13191 RepID=UPI00214E5E9D|nr:matrix metalloproteinase-14-like [Pectinophora gossypiella]
MHRAAPTTAITTHTQPQLEPKSPAETVSAHPKPAQRCKLANNRNMANHSNDNLDEIHELIDLARCRIPNKENNESQIEYERCSFTIAEADRCELHKKEDVYGNESIIRKRVEVDVNGRSRRTADLQFKYARDAQEWMEAVKRTIGVRVRAVAVLGLFLTMLATCSAAPPRSRPTRSALHDKSVRSYLENFGYLRKDRPEVANLLMENATQYYEDDFRIAVKTLQEFGGIPVTGEVDEATQRLMVQKRCGRPDVETGLEGKRRKRFVVQGEKWKHTNLTWSLSSLRRPSQLDPYHTRSVLARALDVWEQASRLTFTEVNSDDADIVVSFAKRYHDDAYPFDGRGSILAHAFFPGSGRGGDAHFDDDELWLLQPKNDDEEGTSLFAVAAHEFGHSLGLSHSSVKGALMFPWYQGIQPNFVLPEDDRNGIQQMYGPKENKRTWAKIPSYRPVETPPTTTTTTTTTTTRRPYIHHRHPNRHPNQHPGYTPYPRDPSKYPAYYPERPNYPHRPSYPEYPNYPDRRRYNTTEEHPRRTHHYPRPTETTTHPPTRRPHYPNVRPEYPYRPYNPTDRNHDYPKKKPYLYPEKTTTAKTTHIGVVTPSDKPDTCDTSYDAVALIRGELFIFKNRYHWRIGANGRYPGYPIEITRMWPSLPKGLTHVDAVYERPDKKIAFFVGKELYLCDSQHLVRGYPKPLTNLGLPESLEKLDAAMVWGYNGKTYFYSGTMYWKYDEDEGRVELDYPRDMSMWKGVGYNIDSVFQWKDGKTYFFKGKGFWKFNDLQMRVEHERQLPSAPMWMRCPAERAGRRAPYRAPQAPGSTLRSPSAATTSSLNTTSLLTSLILALSTYFRYS